MYSNASPFKRISTYVDAIKHEQVKKVLTRARVSYVQWLDMKHLRLLEGKDADVVRWAVTGAGVILLLGAGWWGINKYNLSKVKCADFRTQQELAIFIQKHPKEAKRMDKDRDLRFCEGKTIEVDLSQKK